MIIIYIGASDYVALFLYYEDGPRPLKVKFTLKVVSRRGYVCVCVRVCVQLFCCCDFLIVCVCVCQHYNYTYIISTVSFFIVCLY